LPSLLPSLLPLPSLSQLPLPLPFTIAVAISVAVTIAVAVAIISTPSLLMFPHFVCWLLFQEGDKAVATNDGDVIIVTVLLHTTFVKSTPKTSDKKAKNGDHHDMLKVIQHAMRIAEF
jgi:hypothetical protein